MTSDGLTRRHAIAGAAAVGVGVPLLAACGSGSQTAAAPTSPASGSGGGALAATSDIPVGGGVVFADQKVVVTQPTAGDFKAFSAICTHAGCVMKDVTTTINCPCHGSQFSIEDGSVITPPATAALTAAPITVQGDSITLA